MTPEGRVKHAAYKLFKSRGIWYANQTAVGDGTATGRPDCLLCYYGVFIAIEFKSGRNQPTQLQTWNMQNIRDNGGITFVINERNLELLPQFLDYVKNYNSDTCAGRQRLIEYSCHQGVYLERIDYCE